MSEIIINDKLVGQVVRNAARPEWGDGKVLRIQKVPHGDGSAFRVSIQFRVGHRTLLVPPARLAYPTEERQRIVGWLDKLGGSTTDDMLRQLPQSATNVIGTPPQRLAALLPMYAYTGDPNGLVTWARRQTDIADPLSQWNRDELEVAFEAFCVERDSHFRAVAAMIKEKQGPAALKAILDEIPPAIKPAIDKAIARVI